MNLDKSKPMFPISVIANDLNLHQRTLRIWDEEKILIPGRSPKNRRLYSMNDIEKARFIKFLLDNRVGINGVKLLLKVSDVATIMKAVEELKDV